MKSNIEECPSAEREEYLKGFDMGNYFNGFGLYVGDVVFRGAHSTVLKAFENLALGVKIANPSANVFLVFNRWCMEERFSDAEIKAAKEEIFND